MRLVLQPEEISIGDYVLNGGEVAAMVIIDAVIRLVPGVLGDAESSRDDSFSTASTAVGVCPIHAAPGVPGAASAGDFVERRSRGNRPLAGRRTAAGERKSGGPICCRVRL